MIFAFGLICAKPSTPQKPKTNRTPFLQASTDSTAAAAPETTEDAGVGSEEAEGTEREDRESAAAVYEAYTDSATADRDNSAGTRSAVLGDEPSRETAQNAVTLLRELKAVLGIRAGHGIEADSKGERGLGDPVRSSRGGAEDSENAPLARTTVAAAEVDTQGAVEAAEQPSEERDPENSVVGSAPVEEIRVRLTADYLASLEQQLQKNLA